MFTKKCLALLAASILPLGAALAQAPKGDPKMPKPEGEPTVTKSGLKYWVLEKGKGGDKPAMGDKVKVHYSGWLTNGSLFDSSVKRGMPAEFKLGGVIEGWNQGLQLMSVGDRFLFEIPSVLGYGDRGSPPKIPGGATLMFEVELLGVTVVPKPPKWREFDPAKTKKTDSGLEYIVLEKGEGEPPTDKDAFEIGFALYNKTGKMLQAKLADGERLKGNIGALRLPFMKEAPLLMSPGAKYMFKVPPKLAWGGQSPGPGIGANEETYWYFHMVRVIKPLPLPKFELPSDEELKETGSGLKYKVLREGSGKKPKAFNTVEVHYAGWLRNGKSFDSSYSRGETTTFPLSGVIRGWTEGVQLMKEGAKYLFVIPGNLAYGQRGSPPKIGPNETLVFVIELKRVVR